MSAIDTLFAGLKEEGRKAFMPFLTAGDPDLNFTSRVIRELVARGCHMCELGIPYSDPIADGPVIQASYSRALDGGVSVPKMFDMVSAVTPTIEAPLVTMVSYAIIYRRGPEEYVRTASEAGVAGAIVPDLPADEASGFAEICKRYDFSLIELIAPTTPRDRALKIAERTTGFIYYVSVAGITGERKALPDDIAENVAWLRSETPLPVCIGFGISTPEHIRTLAPVADGLIVGSAIVRRMAEAGSKPREQVVEEIGDYVAELLEAMP